MGACTVCEGIVDVYPEPAAPVEVCFTAAAVNSRLGTALPGSKMIDIVTSLGFTAEETAPEEYRLQVPSWRNDVTLMDDISEEVARIYGFDNIEASTPRGSMMMAHQSERQDFIEKIKDVLTGLGMNEENSFSFTHPDMFDKLNIPADSPLRVAIPVMNPLTDDYPLVRTSLLTSIMENTVRNLSRKNEDVALFEVAPVFFPKALPVVEQPYEVLKLAGALTGRREVAGWCQNQEQVDFYDAKGIVEQLLAALSISKYTVEAGEHFALHPGKTAIFKKGKEIIATVGEVHPKVMEAFSLHQKVYLFEMDIEVLMKYTAAKFAYQHLPKYPATSRDLATVVNTDVQAAEVEKLITKKAGKFLKEVTLFDVYTGKQVAEGKKSLAFNMVFQSNEKTLTDEEIDVAIEAVVKAVEKEFNAELRA